MQSFVFSYIQNPQNFKVGLDRDDGVVKKYHIGVTNVGSPRSTHPTQELCRREIIATDATSLFLHSRMRMAEKDG